MPWQSNTYNKTITFNKHGLYLRWPRLWIIFIGIMLIFLCFCIAGMEVGHTIFDLYRSTAFGGFIVFLPLLICAIFILITGKLFASMNIKYNNNLFLAWKPDLILIRITIILCCIMMILCMVLIAYDILVLIDPTRCFFLNCNNAVVNASNSTTNITVTGWPILITWPGYFQTNMNAKRIFQSIQILLAVLFILFCSLYILTCAIYRRVNLDQTSMYNADQHTVVKHERGRTSSRRERSQSPTRYETGRTSTRYSNNTVHEVPSYSLNHLVTMYTIEGQSVSLGKHNVSPRPAVVYTTSTRKDKNKKWIRPRTSSVNYDRICTRCMNKPRMVLTTNYERQNYFSHLCYNCNQEISSDTRKPVLITSPNDRTWKP